MPTHARIGFSQRRTPFLAAALLLLLLPPPAPRAAGTVSVTLNSQDSGRVFEGIGAVSAGASTRLLADYDAPYAGDILDFLFKPQFGAAFQHLKVEIGGGENSTCGSEPSHAITRAELAHPVARGYEFWLMKEARNRNPKIELDCLPWSYPGFLSGRFSQDSADWFAAFLEVARTRFGLEVDWVSAAQNENGTDRDWIVKTLRPTLDARGFTKVKLQAPDDDSDFWKIFDTFETDAPYRDLIKAVGYHYISGREPWNIDQPNGHPTTEKAKRSGKPLWSSEDWSMSGKTWDGTGALFLARLINKLYILDRITKTELWCPIDSIYDGLPWNETGAMSADRPWSGHYKVWPGLWAVAHTTQFAQPGWQYLDAACGQIDPRTWKGSYVTMKSPSGGDWSMIVCTDGTATLNINTLGMGLRRGVVHVWKSNAASQFIRQSDLQSPGGVFSITLDGNSIYSLTTTVGQAKGRPARPIPADKPFPFPYREDFERDQPGATPRYFAEQKGSFEVVDAAGHGKCLAQVVPQNGIMWQYMAKVLKPYTILGDPAWTDYAVSADVCLAGGDAEVGGRYKDQNKLSYRWGVAPDGRWKLSFQDRTLASGTLPAFDGAAWHTLKIAFSGSLIQGFIDGQKLAGVTDRSVAGGMAYLASTYDKNLFDNVVISEK